MSTVSALLCVAAIGGLATMSTANAGCKFGTLADTGGLFDVHGCQCSAL